MCATQEMGSELQYDYSTSCHPPASNNEDFDDNDDYIADEESFDLPSYYLIPKGVL
jgi:hypothetical protein